MSKLLGLTSALFLWPESGMKDIKLLESVPCFSLNKILMNFGTCFDVQSGEQFPWQTFAPLVIQLFGPLHKKECKLLGAISLFKKAFGIQWFVKNSVLQE